MNRRGFFQTLAAGITALFLPKSKKAESNEEESLIFYDTLDGNLLFYGEGFPTDTNWTAGEMFYDTETRITKIYDGNRWIEIKENQNG
jgi:hypothetical protein